MYGNFMLMMGKHQFRQALLSSDSSCLYVRKLHLHSKGAVGNHYPVGYVFLIFLLF